ncbi:DUF1294 domain-containing protein [Guggenheimella bovis]
MRQILIGLWALLNLFSFILFLADKSKAARHVQRISEKTLLLSALAGGLGAFLSMQLFRHKTKHLRFQMLVPLFFILSLIILFCIRKYTEPF